MKFTSIGYNFCHDKNFKIVRPNGLGEYLLIIIRTKAYFENDGNRINLNPNSLIVFHKKTPQCFGADDDLFINDWVSFDMNQEEERLFKDTIIFDKFIESEEVQICSEIIMLMQKEWHSSNQYKNETLSLFFQIIQKKLNNAFYGSEPNKIYYNDLCSIRTNIYNNPSAKYSVKNLAAELHISPSYFHHLYKKYFKVSPIADAINSRIEYSKQLLTSTNYSVNIISAMLGYSCDTQFMKQFKLITNMTPLEYRRYKNSLTKCLAEYKAE